MYCEKCGSYMPEDATFCGNCGEAVNKASESAPGSVNEAPAAKKAFKINRKLLIIAGCVLVALVICFVAFQIYTNTGRRYLYTALAKSKNVYSGELKKLVESNPVLKTWVDNSSKSFTYDVNISNMVSVSVTDDKRGQVYNVNAEIEGLGPRDVNASLFLSNDKLIAGLPDVVYLEANPKALGDELKYLYDNISDSEMSYYASDYMNSIVEELRDSLNAYDFSYSNITNGNVYKDSAEFDEITELITEQLLNFSDRAEYERTDSTMRIGGENVKTTRVTYTMGADELDDWLMADLMPALRESGAIRKYWDMTYDAGEIYTDYDDTLNELESNIDYFIDNMKDNDGQLILGAQIHKGTIVALEAWMLDDYYNDEDEAPGFIISATGKQYRLNEINLTTYGGGHNVNERNEINISGDHFSKTNFTTAIAVTDYGDTDRISVNWDLTDDRSNLQMRLPGGESLTYTLTAKDGEVNGDFDFDYYSVSFSMKEMEESVTLPTNTTTVQNFSPREAMDKLSELNIRY